ncbi:MAG: efflux transporter outer membrane subunit [Desulfobulbus sp.]|jgi:NodT family efflux transporter outer membrane factor (OMF) lipoprotein|nr:efflux transporter outer membrane subunit [Desulfobulbus sp.]
MRNVKTNDVHLFLPFILAGLLAGCTVGPDFRRPTLPGVATYVVDPLAEQTASAPTTLGETQRFVKDGWVNPHWWKELGSAKLDALIDEALQANPTLTSAQASLRQAQELYSAQSGSTLYPQVDADFGGQRQRFNPASMGQIGDAREFTLYNASVGVQYNFDLFGGNRRALEALAAQVDYQRYQLAGARLTLVGNIVTSAITQVRLAMQIQATTAILQSQEEQLGLTRERVRLGQASPDDVLALQPQVEQTRAGIPLLRKQLQQNEHLLAVLTGRAPGAESLPSFSLEEFTLPAELPLVVPSELVRTRPDIQAAEALLHKANAEYGVEIAKLYPQLNLSANLGSQALTMATLFGSGSAVWSLLGQLTQPLLNPGLPAKKRAALAAFDAAAANYQTVVLESLRTVADVLSALDNDAQRLAALFTADAAARNFLDSMQRRYNLGAASYVELLIAQQQSQQTRINLIEAQAQRLVICAAFYQAMGGGFLRNSAAIAASYPLKAHEMEN